jgi:hypothetical protein
VGNDLDNASIGFQNVTLPKTALLNRFADIEGDEYVQVGGLPWLGGRIGGCKGGCQGGAGGGWQAGRQ